MKFAASIAAVVLFCVAPATESDAQCFRGRGSTGVSVAVGSGVSVQNIVQPVVQTRVRQGLFGRTILRSKVRNQVVQQVVSNPVQTVSSFQFVQPAQFVAALPQPILSYAGYAGYGGYMDARGSAYDYDEDDYLNDRLREEVGQIDQLKENIQKLKDRLGL